MCNASGVRYKVHHHCGRAGSEVFSEEHGPQCRQRSGPARHHDRPLRARADVFHQGLCLHLLTVDIGLQHWTAILLIQRNAAPDNVLIDKFSRQHKTLRTDDLNDLTLLSHHLPNL